MKKFVILSVILTLTITLSFMFFKTPHVNVPTEITFDQMRAMAQPYDFFVSISASIKGVDGDAQVIADGNKDVENYEVTHRIYNHFLYFDIENSGKNLDTYNLEVSSDVDWVDKSAITKTLQIDGLSAKVFNFPIHVPQEIKPGTVGHFTLSVTSQKTGKIITRTYNLNVLGGAPEIFGIVDQASDKIPCIKLTIQNHGSGMATDVTLTKLFVTNDLSSSPASIVPFSLSKGIPLKFGYLPVGDKTEQSVYVKFAGPFTEKDFTLNEEGSFTDASQLTRNFSLSQYVHLNSNASVMMTPSDRAMCTP